MKKRFKKKLVMTKKYVADFKTSTKSWICDKRYVDGDIKVGDHCPVTRKTRDSAHRDCNIKVKFYHRIQFILYNLRNYGSDLILQEPGKLNFKINIMPNALEKNI